MNKQILKFKKNKTSKTNDGRYLWEYFTNIEDQNPSFAFTCDGSPTLSAVEFNVNPINGKIIEFNSNSVAVKGGWETEIEFNYVNL